MITIKKRTSKILSILFCLLPNIASSYFIFILLVNKLFPAKYLYPTIVVIVLLNVLIDWLISNKKGKKASRISGSILLVVVLLFSTVGAYAVNKGLATLDGISKNNESIITVSVIVLKDSPIETADQIKGLAISSVGLLDGLYINKVTKDLSAKEVIDAKSYPSLVSGLLGKGNEVIIFNESYRSLIEGVYSNFKDDTKIIKQYTFKNPNSKSAVSLVDDSNPFNIYISGVDSLDPLSLEGLSDVNIVATVDPIEKVMLLTTIPRDSYVPIALGGNNQKDKLTHSGVYGIDSSAKTIENLLDIRIDGYIKVNFTALIGMVDLLGGIDVENPIGFQSSWGYDFPSGTIHLDGKMALLYSRERKQLEGGDNDRGKNQERVIVAIFNKAVQPESLLNYQRILSVLGSSLQTNLSADSIKKLVNMQMTYGGSWNFDANSISGTPAMGLDSYAMPGSNLYFTELSEDSIALAKDKINKIIKAE